MFTFGDLPAEVFFSEYWRKKPLFLKGGAHFLLDRTIRAVEFRKICDRMSRHHPELVNRKPGCVFAQNMNMGSPFLAERAREVERATSCQHVWFDGVYAVHTEGIGCHYDHSDNFVLQQSGTKQWRLCDPDRLPAAELRARMLEHPGAGLVDMPDDAPEFIVEAGDLLYIPLFWGHWGISDGPSMSISLVMNADNALDLLLPLLKETLDDREDWWRPLPQVPLPDRNRPPPPVVRAHLERLVGALGDPDWQKGAVEALWRQGFLTTRAERERIAAERAAADPYAVPES